MLRTKRSKPKATSGDLRRVLGDIELPMIPALVTAAIEQVSSPDCDLRQVAETVGRDPGLSARLLTTVNSAAYAPRNPIVGVTQAVTMLGRNHLESMLISLAASRAVSATASPGFDLKRFWTVAAWRASVAALLSNRTDRGRSSENFSAALLEDIAVPLLAVQKPGYSDVLADWQRGAGQLADLESEAYGWTHKSVAGWLFDEWGFPESLREAVTDDGLPESGTAAYPVVRVVSTLSTPGNESDVMATTANRITEVFNVPEEEALEILRTGRTDASKLAGSLT